MGGGIPEAVKGLARAQAAAGARVSVLAGADARSLADASDWAPLAVDNVPSAGFANGLHGAALRARLDELRPDLVHLHGLWGPAARALAGWRGGAPHVVSPHGMLDSWALARSAAKKRLSAALWEGGLLRRAAFIHALAGAEEQAVRAYGLAGRVEVVPNGVTCRQQIGPLTSARPRTLLFMARIHPKKGLAELIAAWAMLPPELRHDWHLRIAGWDEIGILDSLRQQAAAAGLGNGVSFPGGLHGADKDAALHGASAFILPSHSEGLPMAVLEAWAHGLPVIMTQACNLPEGFAAGAAVEVTTDPAQMATVLARVLADDSALAAMGAAGRRLALERFAWDTIAARMLAHYHSVVEGR
nr:glycosyltransferase [Alteraurantiacibacter buctensis]